MKSVRWISHLLCTLTIFSFSAVYAQIRIIETLSNFDVPNNVQDGAEVDVFELQVTGGLDSYDLLDIYRGPGSWGLKPRLCDLPEGFLTTWFDRVHPVLPGESHNFGVDLRQPVGAIGDPLPDLKIQPWWGRIEKEPIPFPTFEIWVSDPYYDYYSDGTDENIIGIWPCLPSHYESSVWFSQVRYAFTDQIFPLEEIKWDMDLSWHTLDSEARLLDPQQYDGNSITLPKPTEPKALQFAYAVSDPNDKENPFLFVNWQFVIDSTDYGFLAITRFDINFDLHNITGKDHDNLEFDWMGYLRHEDIKRVYSGENAWGLPPRIQEFDYGSLGDFVSGGFYGEPYEWTSYGGLEITWMDRCDPIPHCTWKHFGFGTGVGVYPGSIPAPSGWDEIFLYLLLLHWTDVMLVEPIPIPWQFWQNDLEGPRIRDIIQFPELIEGPVFVRRDMAVIPEPLPINRLHYDAQLESGPVAWDIVDESPKELSPDSPLEIDIPLNDLLYGACLVRYEVTLPGQEDKPPVRIINQAEFFDPKPTSGISLDPSDIPESYNLSQNYPNPFNMETRLEFGLPHPGQVRIVVYNMMGQAVRTVLANSLPAGTHKVSWDGLNDNGLTLPSGVYFCKLTTKDFSKTIKMMLTK